MVYGQQPPSQQFKELIIDFRRKKTEIPPLMISRECVERVADFHFLGIHRGESILYCTAAQRSTLKGHKHHTKDCDLHSSRCHKRAQNIIKDASHPGPSLNCYLQADEGTPLGPLNHTNDTAYTKPNIEIFKMCIYFVILAIGVIGNGLVIFVTGYKMKRTVNSIWFLNLAIADILYILFLVCKVFVIFSNYTWPFGNFMCKCVFFARNLNMSASVFFLTVISVDRCLCTWFVVWAQNKRILVKARIISVFVWILAICCSIPSIYISHWIWTYKGIKCVYTVDKETVTAKFVVGFLIPFLIIVSSYIAISVRVKRMKRGKQLRPYRIISVILAFFICCFPYHVHSLCLINAVKYNWSSAREKLNAAFPFVDCLVYVNSCLNPILYVFMCDEYKKKLKKSLLLVFEGAFTEEHLRSTPLPQNSQCQQVLRVQTEETTI
ncbi:C3a anaphylatoxin chemotactic receptor-like [Paramisgurnus dabryanus]|uniref:C3a anaphylatoxin chemotactic receptor-like n=1 Tax=Paramisgurnus dabryanus TaxID=90735 RepID=UPI0031F39ADE